MSITPLLLVIVIQVLVFQFLGVRLAEALPRFMVGPGELPEEQAALLRHWRARAGRGRWVLGGVLLLLALLAGLAWGGTTRGKLVLAGISLVSTIAFVGGFLRDRVVLDALASRVPSPAIRTASLEPRRLRNAYAPAWEAVPLAIVVMTLVVTIWAVVGGGPATLFWLPSLQIAVVGGGLLLSTWYARSSPPLPQRVRAGFGDAATAAAVDAQLRRLELRALLAAKVALVLQLAVKQTAELLETGGGAVPGILEWIDWLLLAVLLGVFGAYVLAVTRQQAPRLTSSA